MSEVTVKKYTGDDYAGLIKLLGDVYDSHISKEVLERYYLDENKMIFVAAAGNSIAGCAFLEINHDHVREHTFGFVTYVAVDPGLRKMGIGSKIFDAMTEEAKQKGCTAIELTSANYREDAHAFYDSLGFTVKKTTVFIKELNE